MYNAISVHYGAHQIGIEFWDTSYLVHKNGS
jgi:hypothetical protein